jgi:hypothetical protein
MREPTDGALGSDSGDSKRDAASAPPPCGMGCQPALTALLLQPGALKPAFEPNVTSYSLQLSTSDTHVNVTAHAEAGLKIQLNGEALASGESKVVPLSDGENTLELTVTGRGGASRRYSIAPIRSAQPIERSYVKAKAPNSDDRFGYTSVLDGDTLAVGAWLEDGQGGALTNSGAVFVFRFDGERWNQEAYLKASNAEADDAFGYSLTLADGVIAVGARNEDSRELEADNAAAESGAVYVFRREPSGWRQEAYLKAADAAAGDQFGASVALCADTLVVGASNEDSAATGVDGNAQDASAQGSGAAYVFSHANGRWTQRSYLNVSRGGASSAVSWRETKPLGWRSRSCALPRTAGATAHAAMSAASATPRVRLGARGSARIAPVL